MNKNILIAGIGGQGVNTLSIAIQNTCQKEGYYCKSSIFKGGAQKRGAIYSFIRVFADKNNDIINFSGEVCENDLDIMLSLEYWESIRYMKYYNQDTKILVNANEVTFFSKRYSDKLPEIIPKEVLEKHFPNTIINEYSQLGKEYFNETKMANFIIGVDAIKKSILPFNKYVFLEEFFKLLKLSDDMKTKMKSYVDA
jgi:Pyruvate/2-oxoacid:ferredoxin oxidoreductase gamma subunit